MDYGSAVNSFVPLWIFTPLLLVAVIELLRTAKANSSRLDRARDDQADARTGFMSPQRAQS